MTVGARRALKRAWVPLTLRFWPLARLWYRAWGLRLDGDPDDEVWYFAYGANMHDSVFLGRRRMQPTAWRAGRIRDYRLRFNLEGRPRGRAAPANVSPERRAEVWGVAYRITRRDLVRLNASEGIPGWRYRPIWLDADDDQGVGLRVVAYIAEGKDQDGNPSLRYITILREGARAHGLPESWLELLDRVQHSA